MVSPYSSYRQPMSFEEYAEEESRRYMESSYGSSYGTDYSSYGGADTYAAPDPTYQPEPDDEYTPPAPQYEPQSTDPYHTGDAYSTGPATGETYTSEEAWSAQAPAASPAPADPALQTHQEQSGPYLDPGGTLDQTAGFEPRPVEPYDPKTQLPPGQNALGALFGGQRPYTTANPANAWLNPPADAPPVDVTPERNAYQRALDAKRIDDTDLLRARADALEDQAPQRQDPNTGLYPEPETTAQYEANQYALQNVYSTDQSRGGPNALGQPVTMNPLAWNPQLAAQTPLPGPDDGGLLGSIGRAKDDFANYTLDEARRAGRWGAERIGEGLSAYAAEVERQRVTGESDRLPQTVTQPITENAPFSLEDVYTRGRARLQAGLRAADTGLSVSPLGQSGVYQAGSLIGAADQVPTVENLGEFVTGVANVLWNDDQTMMERTAQQAIDLLETGDRYATTGAGPLGIDEKLTAGMAAVQNATGVRMDLNPYLSWLNAHPELVEKYGKEGYVRRDQHGEVIEEIPPGPAAVVAAYSDQAGLGEDLISRGLSDRTVLIPGFKTPATVVETTGRAIKTAPGAGVLQRTAGEALERTGRVGVSLAEGGDTLTSLGLNKIGSGSAPRVTGIFDPSEETAQRVAADTTQELGAEAAAARRAAFGAAPGTTPTPGPGGTGAPGTGPAPIGTAPVAPSGLSGGPTIGGVTVNPRTRRRPSAGRPSNIPDPRSAMRVPIPDVNNDVNLISDDTGRYWLENPDTNQIIYGPWNADRAMAQAGNAARLVREERARRTVSQPGQPGVLERTPGAPDPGDPNLRPRTTDPLGGFNPDPTTWHQPAGSPVRMLPITEEVVVIERSRGIPGRPGSADYAAVHVDQQGRQTHLGSYPTPGEAVRRGVRARDEMAGTPTLQRTPGITQDVPRRDDIPVEGPWPSERGPNTRYRVTSPHNPNDRYEIYQNDDGSWEVYRFTRDQFNRRGSEPTGLTSPDADGAIRQAQDLADVRRPLDDRRPNEPPMSGSPLPEPRRATQQPAPVDADGITAPLAESPDEVARLRQAAPDQQPARAADNMTNLPEPEAGTLPAPPQSRVGTPSSPLREDAAEIARLRRAAETGQPVDLPEAPPEAVPAPSTNGRAPTPPETAQPPTSGYQPSSAASDAAPRRPGYGQKHQIPDGQGGRRDVTTQDLETDYSRQMILSAAEWDQADNRAWRGAMFENGVMSRRPDDGKAFDAWLRLEAAQYKNDPTATQARWNRNVRTEAGMFPGQQELVKRVAAGENADRVRRSLTARQKAALRKEATDEAQAETLRTGRSARVLGITQRDPKDIATEFFERGQRPGAVRQTAEQVADADITSTPNRNTYSSKWGTYIDEDQDKELSRVLKQGRNAGREVGDVLAEYQDDVDALRGLVRRKSLAGGGLTPAEQAQLDALERKFRLEDADVPSYGTMTDAEADRFVGQLLRREEEISSGARNLAGKLNDLDVYGKGLAGKALKAYDGYLGVRRAMQLYNPTRGPAYVMMNAIGNAISLGIARPSALQDYFRTPQWRRLKERQTQPNVQSWVDETRSAMGLAPSATIRDVNKDELGRMKSVFGDSGWKKALSKAGFDQARDFANVFDTMIREALWRDTFEPGAALAARELRRHATDTLARSRAAGGPLLPLDEARVQQAFDTLRAAKGDRFSAFDVRKALIDAAGPSPLNETELRNFAERMGRDWLNAVRSLDKAAKAEVNRVAFSFNATKADEAIRRFFMFHYWTSRASKLYVTEALKKPYVAAAYFNLMEGLEREAEKYNYPDFLKGMINVWNSPAGAAIFLDPTALIGTLLSGRDAFYGDVKKDRDLTALGEYQEFGADTGNPILDLLADIPRNAMLSPIIEAALRNSGSFGTDTRSNPDFGTRWAERLFNDTTNLASSIGITLPWVTTDDEGSPERFPMNDLSTVVNNAIAQLGSGKLPGTSEVLPRNPDGSTAVRFNAFLLEATQQLNPTMTEEQVADRAAEAMTDPSSPEYQQALDTYSRGPGITVLDGHNLPDWLQTGVDTVVNAVVSKATPFNVLTTSQKQNELADPKTDGQGAQRSVMYGTPESIAFDTLVDGYKNAGSSQGRHANDAYSAIRYGRDDLQTFRIGQEIYTPERLAAMTDEERKQVADDWLWWNGLEGTRREQFAARDQYLEDHPEIAPVVEFRHHAENFPGGVDAFITKTAAINAPYRQFLLDLSGQYPRDSDDFRNIATSYNAYQAIIGQPSGAHGMYNDLTGAGQIVGKDGQIISDLDASFQARKADEDAQFGGDSDYVTDVKGDLETVARIRARLNELDPSGGLDALYMQRAAGDTSVRLDRDTYNLIEDEFGFVFPSGGAGEYIAWGVTQDDPSFERWREIDLAEYEAEQRRERRQIQDINYTGPESLFETAPAPVTSPTSGGNVTPLVELVNVRTAPGTSNDILSRAPAGLPMTVVGEQIVNGERWIQVALPGGRTGWVRSDLLATAAD